MVASADRSSARHPIRVVARRTGLSPALIRAWESRYRAIEPERGSGRQRLYSDEHIARLILLRKATEAGRRISDVAELADAALAGIVAEDVTSPPPEPAPEPRKASDPIDACVELLSKLDRDEVAQVLGELASQVGGFRMRNEILEPMMREFGGWAPAEPEEPVPLVARQLILRGAVLKEPAFSHLPRGPEGGLLLADLRAVRDFVHRVNTGRTGDQRLATGSIHGQLLMQELVAWLLLSRYGGEGRELLKGALLWLAGRFGRGRIDRTLAEYRQLFGSASEEVPQGAVGRTSQLLLLIFLWLANRNPAFQRQRDLFDDRRLEENTGYRSLVASLDDYFAEELGPDFRLLHAIRRPLDQSHRVDAQLRGLIQLLRPPAELVERLHLGLDVLREENRLPFVGDLGAGGADGAGGPLATEHVAPPHVPPSERRAVAESAWMGDVSMVAKNSLVWLHQLGRRFGTEVRHLDQVPGEALAELRDSGFNALWLVGMWRRSRASQRLKRLGGIADAVASAYAVDEYEVADELGGRAAFDRFAERCEGVGLRVACDMVPNHTGMDSRWVLERPEDFVSVASPPFPDYRFTGDDLSPDPDIGLWLEDGYADRSGAAVVFRRLDRRTGEERYLYHGNDGTGLPWNDTAQLDYTRPEVRRAMADRIVAVARQVPILRIDAAMTLTRQHFQRLWYPPPGEGGAIPSRAEHGLTPAEFDARMPREFWLEVTERLADEAPDTLLLAEAFWLMEPFFIHKLGVHRVYHSFFLHATRDERNAELQAWLRDTLAQDPAELRRYVNFLTTPDERPAADAFGKGDKYFAAATLLATLPGLPLFGHGQADGLLERYGMEYARPQYSESPDASLSERHRRQIAPLLLRRRELFAGTERLRLLDVTATEDAGRRIDAVFAYVNGDEKTDVLVLVNNSARTQRGVLHGAAQLGDLRGLHDLQTGEPAQLPTRGDDIVIDLSPYESRVLAMSRSA